jgi:hypothetical protein
VTRPSKEKVLQATAFLSTVGLLWLHLDDFGASEFIGGLLTGKLFTMANIGAFLLLCALVITIFLPRVAAAVALIATLLCLPFYLYIVAPGSYRRIFRGEYTIPLERAFVLDWSAILGIAALIFAIVVSVRSLLPRPSIE